MLATDDRKTWTSTAVPIAARLRLRPDATLRSILDGAWWPRSREPIAELTNLLAALESHQAPVTRIMLNPKIWNSHPRRLLAAGRIVRLGWFTSQDPSLLIATTASDDRVDLLVVSPDASVAEADAAMGTAVSGEPTLRAADIVAAGSVRPTS